MINDNKNLSVYLLSLPTSWIRPVFYALVVGFLGVFATRASATDSFVRVSVVEYETDKVPARKNDKEMQDSLLEQYRSGDCRVVFDASLRLDREAKTRHTDVQWVLVPMGFQNADDLSVPNPMNYMRRGLGTQVDVRHTADGQISVSMIREYMVGLVEARTATPATFVQPTVGIYTIESSLDKKTGDSIVGGGWHEDATNRVCYLIVGQH